MDKEGKIFDRLADLKIKWHFNLPSAPHFDSFWETSPVHQDSPQSCLGNTNSIRRNAEHRYEGSWLNAECPPADTLPLASGNQWSFNHKPLSSRPATSSYPTSTLDDTGGLSCRWWLRAQQLARQFWKSWLQERPIVNRENEMDKKGTAGSNWQRSADCRRKMPARFMTHRSNYEGANKEREGKGRKERKQTVRAAMTEDTEWRIPAAGGETVSTKSCTRNWWHNEGERRGEDVTFQVPSCRKWTMLRIKTSKNKQ